MELGKRARLPRKDHASIKAWWANTDKTIIKCDECDNTFPRDEGFL